MPNLIREIPLTGRLRKSVDGAMIGESDFQTLQNLRYTDANPVGIGGMTKINTTATGTPPITSGFHFRKGQPTESHIMVRSTEGQVFRTEQGIAPIPDPGDFNATPLLEDSVTSYGGRFSDAPQGALSYCNGDRAWIWGGDEFRVAAFVIANGTVGTPAEDDMYDYSEEVGNTRTDGDQLSPVQTAGSYTSTWYVASILPITGLKVYLYNGTAVNGVSLDSVKFWDGTASPPAWATVGSVTDGTKVSANSLKQTGWVTWTHDNQEDKESPRFFAKRYLYWYQFNFSSAGNQFNDANITHLTVQLFAQHIKDLWDQVERGCASAVLYNGTDYFDITMRVADPNYEEANAFTYAEFGSTYLGQFTTTYKLYLGFVNQAAGFRLNFGSQLSNTNAAAITVKYWTGTAWSSLSVDDGTVGASGVTWQQSGYVTWKPPVRNTEQKRTFAVSNPRDSLVNIPLYYYEVTVSANLTTGLHLYYATGVEAPRPIGGYLFSEMHQGRLCLFNNTDSMKNSFLMSAYRTVNVFNGSDSYEFRVGNDQEIVAAKPMFLRHGSLTSDLLVICKRGETWALGGFGTQDDPYLLYRVSPVIGCTAPDTMVSVPVGEPEGSSGVRQVVIWQAAPGIVMFDGVSTPVEISNDIKTLFDPKHSDYVGASTLAQCTAFYDPVNKEYHWIVPNSAEWVFDLSRKKWYEIARGSDKRLYGGFPVQSTTGINYTYGYDGVGYVYRLENGNDFDGNDIAHSIRTADIALYNNQMTVESYFRGYKFICKASDAGNDVTPTLYGDTESVATLDTFSPNALASERIMQHVEMYRAGPYTFHGMKFVISTDDVTIGFEPLMLAIYYEVSKADIQNP